MSHIVRLGVILSVFVIGFAFHLVNDEFVALNYYLGSVELPFSFMLAAALAVGAALGVLACLPMLLKLRRENYLLNKRLGMNEKELDKLRMIPVKDEA